MWSEILMAGLIGTRIVLLGIEKYLMAQTSPSLQLVAEIQSEMKQRLRDLGIPETIAGYREQFRTGPIGLWTDSWGCAGPWPVTTEEYYPDGTGRTDMSCGAGTWIQQFEWRPLSDYRIEKRDIGEWSDIDGSIPDDDYPTPWRPVGYGFNVVDRWGPEIVLYWGDKEPQSEAGSSSSTGGWSYCRTLTGTAPPLP